ncbi:helix-turn-helix domain-containing protein [Fusobacterium nucleatum]|uniref:helix-turn-helix domain-containing protein n=1 Tax=Fusobacterium nucleatum TaxID=851 RepID=UPI0030EDFE0A
MKICKVLGKNVYRYRLEKKYSQEKLAELSNLHRTYISAIELGKKSPSLKTIEVLAKILEVEVFELFKTK